jgi:NTE family protein
MTGKAAVFGGGGVTGVAWSLGLVAGLAERGVDLASAELAVGTSAGAVVAAQLTTGASPAALYAGQLAGPGAEQAASMGPGLLLRWVLARMVPGSPEAQRARIGHLALRAHTTPEAERRAIIAARLPVHDWPGRRLLITAVDAASGAFRVFDRDSGAGLVDAVAASCAVPGVWPPVTIGDRKYVDGGVRSGTNADLAGGYRRVLVIAPIPLGAARQARKLRAAGAVVAVISPGRAARSAIGRNVLDPARRAPAGRAGYAQAATAYPECARIWQEE